MCDDAECYCLMGLSSAIMTHVHQPAHARKYSPVCCNRQLQYSVAVFSAIAMALRMSKDIPDFLQAGCPIPVSDSLGYPIPNLFSHHVTEGMLLTHLFVLQQLHVHISRDFGECEAGISFPEKVSLSHFH